MNKTVFKAKALSGEMITASCVINKHDRLLLNNEDKIGAWIECEPDSLVCEVDESEKYSHMAKLLPYAEDELKSIGENFKVNADGVGAIIKIAMFWTNNIATNFDLYPSMEILLKASKLE